MEWPYSRTVVSESWAVRNPMIQNIWFKMRLIGKLSLQMIPLRNLDVVNEKLFHTYQCITNYITAERFHDPHLEYNPLNDTITIHVR